jgi:hypothetical protein
MGPALVLHRNRGCRIDTLGKQHPRAVEQRLVRDADQSTVETRLELAVQTLAGSWGVMRLDNDGDGLDASAVA